MVKPEIDSPSDEEGGRLVYKPGEVIIYEGDEGSTMFIISSGSVIVSKYILGEEKVLTRLSKGDFFGEMSLLNTKSRIATVTAETDVELQSLNWEMFSSRVTKYHVVARHIIQTLARRLDETLDIVGKLSQMNTATKVMNEQVQQVESKQMVEGSVQGEPILEPDETNENKATANREKKECRILVGTGSRTNEKIIRGQLENFPHTVEVEGDGPSVLRAAQSGKFDILLVQRNLESLSGIEVCGLLASNPNTSQLPVLVFSSDDTHRADARSAGARAFITVPFYKVQLTTLLRKILTQTVTIMHVDDNKTVHTIIREMLADDTFDLIPITDPHDAVEAIELKRPDIILMDVEMPGMTGYELCEKIKNDPKTCDISVVICSRFYSGLDINKGFEAGADDYLPKPIDRDELLSRIRPLIDRKVRRGRAKILVVDDSRSLRNHIVQGLANQGFTAMAAENGIDALAILENHNPELILTDLEMPKMGGREFVLKVRENPNFKLTPIIMLSNRDNKSGRAKGFSAGVDEYITKPFTMDKLIVIVERMLSEYSFRKQHEAIKMYLSDAVLQGATESFCSYAADGRSMRVEEKFVTVLFCDIVGF